MSRLKEIYKFDRLERHKWVYKISIVNNGELRDITLRARRKLSGFIAYRFNSRKDRYVYNVQYILRNWTGRVKLKIWSTEG